MEGYYHQGKKDGVFRYYTEDGILYREAFFEKGVYTKEIRIDE